MSDKYGRKRLLFLSGVIFFVSALGSAFPPSLAVLICARVLGGAGIGIASTLAPVYLAELSPPAQRGRIVTVNQLAIVTGILIAYGVSWGFSYLGANSWRWMFGSAALPALAFALATLTIPESPRWLFDKGHSAAAATVLERLGTDKVAPQIERMARSSGSEQGRKEMSLRLLWKPLALAISLAILQQITGINTVLYYGAILFKEHAGISSNSAVGANVLIGLVNFVFTLVAMGVVDRLPRRMLLGCSSLIMALALLGLSLSFHATRISFRLVIAHPYLCGPRLPLVLVQGFGFISRNSFPRRFAGGRCRSLQPLSGPRASR